MHLIHRKTCRVCGSSALTPVINLGDQYLQGSFDKPGKQPPPHRKIPLVLVRGDPTLDEKACGLLQMEHSAPPEILYSAYWYRSGTNATMRNHLQGIVESAVGLSKKEPVKVLDIGCNDATLLRFYPKNTGKFGFHRTCIDCTRKNLTLNWTQTNPIPISRTGSTFIDWIYRNS